MNIHKQLRAAITASDLSLRELAKKAGTSHSQLSRFVHGEREVSLPVAERLCRVLGLELRPAVPETPPAKKKGK